MKRPLVVCVLLLLAVPHILAEQAPAVTVIASPSIRHVPSANRVTRALRHAAAELNVEDRTIPNLVLVCANRQTAAVMMLAPDVDLSIDTLVDSNRQVYRVTLVGDASDRAVAVAMVWFINSHFRLGWSSPRLMKLAAHIRDDLEQTVDATELAKER